MSERRAVDVVGARVRALREDRGWSQTRLAAEVRRRGSPLDQPGVSDLETGKRAGVDLDLAWVLADVLDAGLELLAPPGYESQDVGGDDDGAPVTRDAERGLALGDLLVLTASARRLGSGSK